MSANTGNTQDAIVASATGAFIGTLIAVSLSDVWFVFGIMIGALIGYSAYQFREIITATKDYLRLIGFLEMHTEHRALWARFNQSLKIRTVGYGYLYLIICTIGVIPVLTIFYSEGYSLIESSIHTFILGGIALPVCMLIIAVACALVESSRKNLEYYNYWFRREVTSANEMRDIYKRYVRPDRLVFHLICGAAILIKCFCRLLHLSVTKLPIAIGCGIAFVILRVHCQERTACATNAAIGALVGYYFEQFAQQWLSSPLAAVSAILIGATIGALLGWKSYQALQIPNVTAAPAF